MTEAERIQEIRDLRFEWEKGMLRLSQIILKLNAIGCEAWVQVEQQGNSEALMLHTKIVDAPAGMVLQ